MSMVLAGSSPRMDRWKFCPYDGHTYRPSDTACSVCYRLRQPVATDMRSEPTKPKWRKILYEKQPYPDNHTDEETFLDALRTNCMLDALLAAYFAYSAC